MKFDNAYIPLDAAWSSPFVRWQGPAAEVSSLDVAAQVTARALEERGGFEIDELVLRLRRRRHTGTALVIQVG
jgi:hypothetical protein